MSSDPLIRPRRASRAPSRLVDENVTAAPRLLSKSSLASMSATGKSNKIVGTAVSATTTKLTAGVSLALNGTRKALGDVSNATRVAAPLAERTGKDVAMVKPSRARTQSATASVSTGFSKLKIGSSAAPAIRLSRPTTTVDTSLASKPSTQSLRSRDDRANELEILHERSLDGLGLKTNAGQDWTADEMYGEAAMHLDQPISHKRDHIEALSSDNEEDEGGIIGSKVRIVEGDFDDPDDWIAATGLTDHRETARMVERAGEDFDEHLDYYDTTMVAEYSEEIFTYMSELENQAMPNPRYMDGQHEIEWAMRTTLIDWLLQVHMRYHMLPETLWIAINILDRFCSVRCVSLTKFQLVGVTAMFVAAKYEEIMAPSVDEFVFMTEKGYTKEEILKGERVILGCLEFNISPYCSPYSWVRRISKADDYDIQTRTLSKFLMEVTLLDHRFLRARPSMIAAIGMYLARRMLGGEWNEAFIYYSDYTEAQLIVPTGFLLELLAEKDFEERFVYKKYASKRFLKASSFARTWAKSNPPPQL